MRHGKLFDVTLLVFALLLVLAGCAKPPEAEKQTAKAAMDTAVSAGADKYAAADLDAAKKVWDTAESQMNDKKYKEAKQSYIDAKAAFEKAGAAVEAGKKAVSDQATAALTALEESWKKTEAAAQKMAKQMKDKKGDWEADAKAFTEGLAKTKEMIANDAAGAKAKVDELKAIADKWESTLKEMAAAPAKAPVQAPAAKKEKK